MNERAKQQKIARFLADAEMADYVKDVMLMAFLKERKGADVHVLAAKSLAIDFLQEAFRELDRYRTAAKERVMENGQPGL
jgi:hypothetical protein